MTNIRKHNNARYCVCCALLGVMVALLAHNIDSDLTRFQGQLKAFSKQLSVFPYPENRLERRVLATILGAAVGDALGRVTEFIPTMKDIKSRFKGEQNISLERYFKDHLINGEIIYTDDTVMAKIVLETALEGRDNEWTEQEIVRTMAIRFMPWVTPTKWMSKDHADQALYEIRAHGTTNQNAMRRIYSAWQQGESQWWDMEGEPKQIANEGGCGSVMRAWPLGLVFVNDEAKVISLAMAQSRITHRSPMAQAACAALAVGIAQAVKKVAWGPENGFVARMIAVAKQCRIQAEEQYKIAGEHPSAWQGTDDAMRYDIVRQEVRKTYLPQNKLLIEDMLKYAVAAALGGDAPEIVLGKENKKGGEDVGWRSTSGALLGWAADEALAAALYIFVRYTDAEQIEKRRSEFAIAKRVWNDKDIIWYALQEGAATPGDSDSIASLAGALMGAYHSTQIPESEKYFLVNYFESFVDFVKDARWIATPHKTGQYPLVKPTVTLKLGGNPSESNPWQSLLSS